VTTRDLTGFYNILNLLGSYLDKHDEHLVVFGVVQNVVVIGAVVLILCRFQYLYDRLEKAYSPPKFGFLGI